MDIQLNLKKDLKKKPEGELHFGVYFTDHMFVMDYTEGKGWHDPIIMPYGPIQMDPACCTLHYGQGIFEGMKAYYNKNGKINLFRPMDNFKRLNRSAEKVCIPEIDPELAYEGLKKLIEIDQEWVPKKHGESLYIRPFIIASDHFLGVNPSKTYKFIIICSPVGAYYPEGLKPVKIMVEENHVRAVAGGLGEAKTMANYAASLLAGEKAKKIGYTQVLWLDGVEKKYIEEVGTMNILFKIDGKIITPALNGSILAGITRDSVIKVLKKWGYPVEERRISIQELLKASEQGKLEEIFGMGTAAVISPVSELKYKDEIIKVGEYSKDSLAMKVYDYITGVQYGDLEDEFNWTVEL